MKKNKFLSKVAKMTPTYDKLTKSDFAKFRKSKKKKKK